MLADLGAAPQLADLGPFAEELQASRVFHVTGYAFLDGPIRETARRALELARSAGVTASLDVADPFVVEAIRDDLWGLLRDHVDLVFLNAEEASALCEGLPPEEALHRVAEVVRTVVVKLGRQGSLVKEDGRVTPIGIHPVEPVDTTGAGDAYAAGYLYGYVQQWSPARCGRLGARVAALSVSQVGAVPRDRAALEAAIVACKEQP